MPDGQDLRQPATIARLTALLSELEASLGGAAWTQDGGPWRVERESGGSHPARAIGPAGEAPALVVPDVPGESGRSASVGKLAGVLPQLASLARAAAWLQALRSGVAGPGLDPSSHARLLFQAETAVENEIARLSAALVGAAAETAARPS